ncbi:MAG: hypothetical protein LUD57_04170 [Ruminococcus sp.]|nr:hypothetical protein [Ruminococcus sp.]
MNKLTKTYTPYDSDTYSITENQYDKNGNVILTKQTVQEENSDTAEYSVTKNEYNAQGLLTQVTLSDGTSGSEKNITQYFYNSAGVQTKMYTGLHSSNDTDFLTTNYVYDAWGHLVKTTDSTGYDSGTITYDLNGNVLTTTDSNGNVTTNTYDALNRVLTADTTCSDTTKNVSKSYTYDNMGRVLTAVSDDVKTSYTYDALGRTVTETETDGDYTTVKGYTYVGVSQYVGTQTVGVNSSVLYSDTSYEYDDEMRISKVLESDVVTASYTYDANGNKASETSANGVVSTYTYNGCNKITSITTKSGEITISAYEYSYFLDGSDACKVRTENGIIEETTYAYDNLRRLVTESVSTGGTTTDTYAYEYDDYSNRIQMTASGTEDYVTEYSYEDADGNYTALLQSETKTSEESSAETALSISPVSLEDTSEVTTYTYDANGNQITKTADDKTETNTYDGLNQLIGYTDGETEASYSYNVDGLRIQKVVDGETIHHVWDGNKQIIADITDDEIYEADCYIRGTSLIATYSYSNGSKSDYTYYVKNAHGDVVLLTDADGAITKSYTYDAFGVEKNIDDADANVFRYCGEYYDAETGTVYLRARYYDPTIGRFISRDSYAGDNTDPLSLNLYTYCQNNPILGTDPTGHWVNILIGAVVGGLISGISTAIDTYKETGEVDIGKTLISTATGAVSGAVAATGLGAFAQAGITAVVSAAGEYTSQVYDNMHNKEMDLKKSFTSVNAGKIVKSGVVGGVLSFAGGKIGNKLSNKFKVKSDELYESSMKKFAKGYAKELAVKGHTTYYKNSAKDYAKSIFFKNRYQRKSSVVGSISTSPILHLYNRLT